MDKLKPRVQEGVHEWLKNREKKTRQWYNRTSDRKYIAFKSGQNEVDRTSHDKFWKPEVILGKHKMPRSYLLQNYRGNVIRRTSEDLRPSYNYHAPVKNYSDLATISGDINMRVEEDRDLSEKTISTMQDAVERETVLSDDEENWPGWSESDIHVQQCKRVGKAGNVVQTETVLHSSCTRPLRKLSRKPICTDCVPK
ncbi:hypothetical protein PR048_013061 [Dryococelus australis]|uniref:Uncharacterized protein n=1 Tax=Dryococelus australis TaxID=614101 RepID=A0ABQ9HR49_9NEOP|nr:hypothetical protein PR048_013061 [Dryococelus australis]